MPAEITVTVAGQRAVSLRLQKLPRSLYKHLREGFRKIGVDIVAQTQANLSGPGRRRGEGEVNTPFPGTISGHLKRSVFKGWRLGGSSVNSLFTSVGPTALYAPRQEFGYEGTQPVTPKMRRFLHHIGIHLKKETDTIRQYTPKRPYLVPAFMKLFNKIMGTLHRALRKSV